MKDPSQRVMQFIRRKADSRKKAGKDTTFFYNGVEIPIDKIKNFQERKTVKEADPISPCPGKTILLGCINQY
jgi:hypothetical protein